jgi:hypothetical protein
MARKMPIKSITVAPRPRCPYICRAHVCRAGWRVGKSRAHIATKDRELNSITIRYTQAH